MDLRNKGGGCAQCKGTSACLRASSEQTNVEYASVWLWAVERNPERRESLNKIREELTAKYCSENSKDVHLTGQQVFYELSFFTEYETKYGTRQYYEKIYRQLCQVENAA